MQPFWRPNFVNQAELPDIKVVRTDFIINFIAVTLALCVVFYTLQREYRSYALGEIILGMEQQIRVDNSDDIENLKRSVAFRESAQYIVEVEKFFDAPLIVHEFLYDLADIRPEDLIFSSLTLVENIAEQSANNVRTYSITISGDAKNLTVLDDFKKILYDRYIGNPPSFTLKIEETLQGRDDQTGIFAYRMAITLTPIVKKAVSAKGGGGDES